jgi:hypothetical protein
MENLRAAGMAQPDKGPSIVENFMRGTTANTNSGATKPGATSVTKPENTNSGATKPGATSVTKPENISSSASTSTANYKPMSDAKNTTGYAKGGIASGSISGYQAELHGTEAVVPLPDNKSIPVKLDSSALTATLNEHTGLLSSILVAMNKGNSLSSGILQNGY